MGKVCRKVYSALRTCIRLNKDTCIIYANQLRTKLGLVFGNPETVPGGNALKYATAVRVDLRKDNDGIELEDELVVGEESKYTIVKNKTAPPRRKGSIKFFIDDSSIGYKTGELANELALIKYGEKMGKLTRSGKWYAGEWLGKKKVDGQAKMLRFMFEQEKDFKNKLIVDIENMIRRKVAFRF
jgi:recombination protein RecA